LDKPDQQRDFFVSYTQADRAWAEWLAWELEAAGYTTQLQAWDMPAGTAFLHVMDQAVQHARHTILVLSPAYLRSAMAQAEWRPGFKADPSGQARRLLPVRVEDCEPKGLLADRVWIDLVGADEATARARLREEVARALRGPGRPTTPPRFPRAPAAATARPRFPTALPSVWNLPYRRNSTFTGRDELLASLAGQLAGGGAAAVTQVLQGGGGVGKTSLAVEYAYRHRGRFDTVWWARAEQPATLLSDLTDLAVTLGVADPEEASQQPAAAAVRRWLDDHNRWLLVLDNAGAPDTPTGLDAPLARVVDLLPQVGHGQVLVTSRGCQLGAARRARRAGGVHARGGDRVPAGPLGQQRPGRRNQDRGAAGLAAAGVGAGRRLRPRNPHPAGDLYGSFPPASRVDRGQGPPT
jgi:hypothetical protein